MTLHLAGAPVYIGATRDEVLFTATNAVLEVARNAHRMPPSSRTSLSRSAHTIVVSGGATTPALARLIAESWPFTDIPTLIVSDERWSADPAMSNASQLAEYLAGSSFASSPVIAPAPDGDIAASAHEWSRLLDSCDNPFVSLLSMGDDGHVASLFPGCETEPVSKSVIVCRESPKPPPTRFSLSVEYLRRVPLRFAFAIGADKAQALHRIAAGESLPAGEVHPTCWFIDEAAAGSLRR